MSTLLLNFLDGDEGHSVRGMMYRDDMQVYSVYDYVNRACNKPDQSSYGNTTFFRLTKRSSVYGKELTASCKMCKFPGSGQRATPCMTVQDLMVLTKHLGTKVSKAFKEESLEILQRYLEGDKTLCAEIGENKEIGVTRSYAKFTEKILNKAKAYALSEAQEMPPVTFVYGTQSDAFPNLIKIGRSVDLTARLSTLNTSCAPAPHRIVATSPTFDGVRDEAMAHAYFSSKRKEGEFFEVSASEVKLFFSTHILAQHQLELAEHMDIIKTRAPMLNPL
jgi:hypothetical protein